MIQYCPKKLGMPVKDVCYRTWPVTRQSQAPGDTVPIALVTTLAGLRIPYMIGTFFCNSRYGGYPSFLSFSFLLSILRTHLINIRS
jgi:hypothetical protein